MRDELATFATKKTRSKKHIKKTHHTAKKIVLGLIAAGFLFAGGFLIWASTVKLPDLSNFEARKIANSSKITDRTGEVVLYDINQGVRRTEIPLEEMGENIPHAVISIEDIHFYEHNGIRPTSIIRAILINLTNGKFNQGGSTITQQIIKNTLLNTDKTVTRKFKEWILAIKLERQFTKNQILSIYLNDAPLGGTIYGVEEASKVFFSKSAKDVDAAEAAYIAAIINLPTYYSPYGKHRAELDERKNIVLEKMKQAGYIDETTYESARAETVVFNAQQPNSIKAPHFVFYILDYLQQKYGADVMENGGYTIKTTLDWDLQQQAEAIVKDRVLNETDGTLKKYNASNQGLVAMDPKTGQILSMVGSRDYFDKTIDGAYNVALAQRQPGSSFKPFVYATAFSLGYTPDTILFDVPTEFSTNCSADEQPLPGHTEKECYHPSNFDNKFKGPISLRSAIAESRNVPSVKLLYLVGVQHAVDTAHALGITTLQDPKEIGLSLVLGGGEVKLLDMVSAYSVFANAGVRNPVTGILEIDDHKGNVVEQFQDNSTQVFDKNAALEIDAVLSDAAARAPTFGSAITIPGVAVKTGTTNNDRDAWTLGYTPNLAVGVWSGNNDNTPMRNGGSAVSGPTWMKFMQEALKKYPATSFESPIPDADYNTLKPILRGQWMGGKSVYIDKITGMLATDTTPEESKIEKIITDVQTILYWVDKNNPRGPAPTNPNSDPQFHLWDPPVQTWWANNQANYPHTSIDSLPTGYDSVHTQENEPSITISGLPDTFPVSKSQGVKIGSTNGLTYPLTSAMVYVDGIFITTLSNPFTFTLEPSAYGLEAGSHKLSITATNTLLAKATKDFPFTLTQ